MLRQQRNEQDQLQDPRQHGKKKVYAEKGRNLALACSLHQKPVGER
jgi:hypothetical protein